MNSRELAEISTQQSRVPVIFREEVDEVGLIPQNTLVFQFYFALIYILTS